MEVTKFRKYYDFFLGLIKHHLGDIENSKIDHHRPHIWQSQGFNTLCPYKAKIRSEKVSRYLRKKMRRKWAKKIIYHSRKQVADTRPRFKGRFVSVDQADEFNRKLRREMQEKLRKQRIFITQKYDKKSGVLLKTVYPTLEAYQNEFQAAETSKNSSETSKLNIEHNNEVIVVHTDLPEYE